MILYETGDQASSDARCIILLSENEVKYELYIRQSDSSLSLCIIDRPPAVQFFFRELIHWKYLVM